TASLGYFTKDKNRQKNKQNGHNQEQADILMNSQFYMLATPLFVLTIVEIEDFALRVAILDDPVIRVVIGEERCVTSLITAAKETINMTIFQKIGDCERPKDWCTSQDLLTQLESFCRAIYGNKSGIAE
ncbi:unnamed protein product, partial [Porites evermanni]